MATPNEHQAKPLVISVINLKGGTGKTTSCIYIAAALFEGELPVTIIDADNEQSALNWAADGTLPFAVIGIEKDQLRQQVKSLKSQGQIVLIDCGPNNRDILYTAALNADIIIVPVAPTGQDVNRLQATLTLLLDIEESRNADLTKILITRWDRRRVLAREFVDLFKDYPVLKNKISDRVIYQKEFGITPTYLSEYREVAQEILQHVS